MQVHLTVSPADPRCRRTALQLLVKKIARRLPGGGASQWLGEAMATFALILTILGGLR